MDHQSSRELFNKCLNKMFTVFASVAKVEEHRNQITEYLEAHDRAKGLLSELARESSDKSEEILEGTEGQDRKNYSDLSILKNYS